MDTGDALSGDPAPAEPAAAAERGEHWWPVALAILVVAGLHLVLPTQYRVNPRWVVPVVLLVLLAVLIIGDPGRIDRRKPWLRVVTGIVIAFITVANLFSAARLVVDILTNNKIFANNAIGLLATGGVIWATNVIAFALWYWDLDRGGAAARAHRPRVGPAFVFPEMQHPEYAPAAWVPRVHRLPVAGLLDRHRVQPHGHLRDQAVGQAPHDRGSVRIAGHGRAGDRPRGQHPEIARAREAASAGAGPSGPQKPQSQPRCPPACSGVTETNFGG
jgi:hypothetical protein